LPDSWNSTRKATCKKGGENTTNFDIIGFENRLECHVELVRCEDMKVSRRPSQVFNFKDPVNFVDAIKGKGQVIVYVGKVKAEDGTESWKAFYWESTDQVASHSWNDSGSGKCVLPPGSIAWLEMETEYDLEWALRDLQDEFRKFSAVTKEVQEYARKIRNVSRTHKFSDEDVFKYMSIPEKEKLLPEMKLEYEKLVKIKKPALLPDKDGDEILEGEDEDREGEDE